MTAPVTVHGRRPVGIDRATLQEGSYLGDLQRINVEATLPHIIAKLDESKVLENLRREPGTGEHVGFQFSDSDLYKTLEAIGWEIVRTGTDRFDGFLTDSYALLRQAQQADGYINSWGLSTSSPGLWVDLMWGHELYCAGHLFQAAVALNRAGRPELLEISRPFADLIVEKFRDQGTGGHPEIETALVELYRETGERSYLDAAAAFIRHRGAPTIHHGQFGPEYFQDHESPRTARIAIGHAVRQLYLDAGCVDLAVETGDEELLDAVVARWESAHHRRMYVTGGMGSRFQDESFGDDHELSSERSYAETCAAIADFQLSWRLLLQTGQARYAAAMERTLYNLLPAAVSADGTQFTYANPHQVRSVSRIQEHTAGRLPWFSCACCPPNMARLRASLAAYAAFVYDAGLALALPAAGRFEGADGAVTVAGDIEDGALTVTPEGTLSGLRIRVPEWSTTVLIDGAAAESVDGWLTLPVDRATQVSFDVTPRLLVADPRVDAVRGCVAVQAGPTVMCAEAGDNESVDALAIDPASPLVGGPRGVTATGAVLETDDDRLYRPYAERLLGRREVPLTLIPYRDWGRDGRVAMRVWLPVQGS